MISWPPLIVGLVLLGVGVALSWRNADVADLWRAADRRMYGSSRYGKLLQESTNEGWIRAFGFVWCAGGLVNVVMAFV